MNQQPGLLGGRVNAKRSVVVVACHDSLLQQALASPRRGSPGALQGSSMRLCSLTISDLPCLPHGTAAISALIVERDIVPCQHLPACCRPLVISCSRTGVLAPRGCHREMALHVLRTCPPPSTVLLGNFHDLVCMFSRGLPPLHSVNML